MIERSARSSGASGSSSVAARQWQLVRLPGGEADGATGGIGDHARLGPIAAAQPTERLPHVALCRGSPFFAAPAPLWCARMLVPSRPAIPASTPPRCCASPSIRSQAPSRDPATLLRQPQHSLPGAQPRPAAEGLRRHPPRAQLGRDLAPLRATVVPPDDRLDGAAQVVRLRLVPRTARRDPRGQQLPQGPLGLRAGAPANEGGPRPRPLRGAVLGRPAPPRPDGADRLRLPAASPAPAQSQAGAKSAPPV